MSVAGTVMADPGSSKVVHVSTCALGSEFNNMSMGMLGWLARHPEHPQMQLVDVDCHGIPDGNGGRTACPSAARFQCISFFSEVTACDECRKTYEMADAMSRVKKHWEKLCPPSFRDTSRAHPQFPKSQDEQLKAWTGDESLFFYGPTGQGKSRLAMLLLKRAMLKNHWTGVLWPERLRTLVTGYDSTAFDHYAAFDVLLLDDALITACRESKLVDAVKMLVDVRMRNKKATIVTSQIGTEEEIAQGKEFGDAKSADLERIKALLRRLRENCRVVPFVPVAAKPGEAEF